MRERRPRNIEPWSGGVPPWSLPGSRSFRRAEVIGSIASIVFIAFSLIVWILKFFGWW